MALTYSSYLKVEELLSLQQPLSDGKAHDEMLFIVIHQAYELWFKQILHELDYLQTLFQEDDSPRILHTLKRVISIQKILLDQIVTLETMTPPQFMSFRDLLGTASGFQSFQFRELEFVLGFKNDAAITRFPEGSEGRRRLEIRFAQPALWDGFLRYLSHCYEVPRELIERDVTQPVQPSAAIREILIRVYEGDPALSNVCESLLDMDEGFQEWRYRHVKMVERMIGEKPGTGGSSGVGYLKKTLFRPAFPDLWLIRTELNGNDYS
jgi:tryptophan 2,3-dioxygenase